MPVSSAQKIANGLRLEGQSLFHRAMIAVWVIMAIASAALIGLVLWSIRAEQIRSGRQINESLTLVIDEQTTNTFKAADLALIVGKNLLLQARASGTLDVDRARALLRSVLVDRSIIRAIWVLNESGTITYDSDEGNIGLSLSDRPYFRFHRDNPDRQLLIGDAVLSRSVGTWFISMSRPIVSPDGKFEGVIVTAIETLYFKRIWDRIDVGENSTIALIRRDGTLVMRSPVNDQLYGQKFPSPTFVARSAIAPTGTYPTVSPVDGVKRYISYSVLSYYPDLALLVGRSQDVILATWWRFVYVAVIGWVVAVAMIGALLYWLQRARRRDLKNQEEAGKILRAAEEQLRQAQKMEAVGQLTGGIAHDFNNLLTVVLGNAEILAESLTDNPRLKHLAEMMSRAAQHGASLTGGLLAFARKQTLQPKVTDINDLVRRLDGLLRRTLGEHIEISLVLADDLGRASVDPAQLEVAILNLAVNARDAMPNGGRLTVETANAELDEHYAQQNDDVKAGPYVRISVTDTGTGISRENLKKVFDPFFTTKELGKGTGLGLSMVYGFVKQSDGHVNIYSEIGYGTTVTLYLPRTTAASDMRALPSEPAEIAGGRETVLVVEDDGMVRSYVQSQLVALGYNVLAARDGQEALEILRQNGTIDLLFTDVVMPGGLNGPELMAQALRLRPALKGLYTSGYAESMVSSHAPPGDGVVLLRKPYLLRDLAAALRKVLDAPAVLS